MCAASCTRSTPAFPFLKRTPGAHALAMCSTSAEYGAPEHAVYSATKFFVRGLTEALNIEYRRHDIQVSAIYVAYVQTGMVFDAKVKPASIERMGVKVTPGQVAETAWRAVHGNRSHWRVGADARLMNLVARLLGSRTAAVNALAHAELKSATGIVLGTKTGADGVSSRCAASVPPQTHPVSSAEDAALVEVAERGPVPADDARTRPNAVRRRGTTAVAPAGSRAGGPLSLSSSAPVGIADAQPRQRVGDEAQAVGAVEVVAPEVRLVAVHPREQRAAAVAAQRRSSSAAQRCASGDVPLRRQAGVQHA